MGDVSGAPQSDARTGDMSGNQRWVRMELALVLAEATGRRIGSIRQLTWTDFDFNARKVCWRAEADKKRKAGLVPMSQEFFEELKSFRVNLGGAFGGLLFPSPANSTRPVGREVFQHALSDATTHAKLPAVGGWHAFRRKWAQERKHHPLADVHRRLADGAGTARACLSSVIRPRMTPRCWP